MAEEQSDALLFGLGLADLKVSLCVFLVTLLLVKMVMMVNKRHNSPPGPWGLPIVGYLPFFGPKPHVTFMKLRKKYGDVISIKMGSWPAVVLNGSDVIHEALVTKKDDFAGRPAFTTSKLLSEGKSIGFMNFCPLYKLQRKIVSNVIYAFSNARKNPVEDIIRQDAKTVIQDFVSQGSRSFCPLDSLGEASSSMIYQLCYGLSRNIREDEGFLKNSKNARDFTDFTGAGNPLDVMPWLRHVMPGKVSRFMKLINCAQDLMLGKVKEHEASFDGGTLRDICDGLIQTGNNLTEQEKATGLDKRQVVTNLNAIFGAGSGTVSATLKWFVALMATHPEVQEDLFQQVNAVVGQGRDVTLADRAQLPLVEATFYEVLRYVGTIPFAIPHATTRDTTLQGYDIPEGTVVMINLFSVLKDEKLWGDPEVFRPQRFLDEDGQLNRTLVEQAPVFSLGRRRCVGEFLARMELFLFTATLLQRLQFLKPPGQQDLQLREHCGLSIDVEPFDICVSLRK